MFKAVVTLLTVLPEILKLIKRIEDAHKEQKTKRKIADDLRAIDKAFINRDANLINNIFNGVPDERTNTNGE